MKRLFRITAFCTALIISALAILTALNNFVPEVRSLYIYLSGQDSIIYIKEHIPRIYGETPILARLHVAFGFLMVVIWPFQFWTYFRRRYWKIHRLLGSIFVVSAVVVGITAMALGILVPYSGILESIIVVLTSIFFLYFVYRAVTSIRRKDRSSHREWMTRSLALALGIATQRAWFSSDLFQPFGFSPEALFVMTALLGFYGNLLIAEMGIRYLKRESSDTASNGGRG